MTSFPIVVKLDSGGDGGGGAETEWWLIELLAVEEENVSLGSFWRRKL